MFLWNPLESRERIRRDKVVVKNATAVFISISPVFYERAPSFPTGTVRIGAPRDFFLFIRRYRLYERIHSPRSPFCSFRGAERMTLSLCLSSALLSRFPLTLSVKSDQTAHGAP